MNTAHYTKLKTNLRLAVSRLKLSEKKKTELALKTRREIADFIAAGKPDRARIRVEQIIREDYLVEAMELLEMFCDLLIARFGLIQQLKTLDDGLAEAISSLIWVAPRLQGDITELKVISDLLTSKYGKQYAQAARENALGTVSPKLLTKLSVQAPPKVLVEQYMIEIAKSHNIPFEPDPEIMAAAESAKNSISPATEAVAGSLIDLGPAPPLPSQPPIIGFTVPQAGPAFLPVHFPPQPPLPSQPPIPNLDPVESTQSKKGAEASSPTEPGASAPNLDQTPPPNYDSVISGSNASTSGSNNKPTPAPRNVNFVSGASGGIGRCPELPEVPTDSPIHQAKGDKNDDESIDFDDLTKRFEQLKKKK